MVMFGTASWFRKKKKKKRTVSPVNQGGGKRAMDPEQILLDNNDFEDGSDYGDYEFIQDQDALSLNAPLEHQ